ncbi:TetR/AcrR family transcriptional regulator [Kribbella deserti]|uniref:TetR/AcrR family transcriptional regulator n=1 Tax=Kribbella deserti TaxID=1926257 RepID=A0ABV6QI13_9ACTN
MAAIPVRERTRRDIVNEAIRLFGTKGYAATSLQDIASAVGCSKATVLYHFNGKPGVLASVLEPPTQQLAALVAEAATLPPAQAQEHAATAFIELSVQARGLITVLNEIIPILGEQPEFSGLLALGEQLLGLLAGTDDELELAMARYALNGMLAECRDPANRPDDELRLICRTAMSRLLPALS